MLEKPELPDEELITCMQSDYGLLAVQVTFLPIGADLNTAVYRVVTADETPYFLKLRRSGFDETSVTLPKWLSDQGIRQIIAPITTKTGQLWVNLDAFTVILYPFVEGHDGYTLDLSARHWQDFGAALKRIHTANVPPALVEHIQRETYCPLGREHIKSFLARIEDEAFTDPITVQLAAFLQTKRAEVFDLVERAEQLAQILQAQSPDYIVCHSDLHAGNILIDGNDKFYIVDWDNPILAPKERDLMFIGGGQGFTGHTRSEEETLFYQAYGQTQIDPVALAYYRYERIVQDIAVECEQIFSTQGGGEDRAQALRYLLSNFQPHQVLAIAYASDKTRNDG